jgi:hypothetical protein
MCIFRNTAEDHVYAIFSLYESPQKWNIYILARYFSFKLSKLQKELIIQSLNLVETKSEFSIVATGILAYKPFSFISAMDEIMQRSRFMH